MKTRLYFLLSSCRSQKYIRFQMLSEAHVSQLEILLWGASPVPVAVSPRFFWLNGDFCQRAFSWVPGGPLHAPWVGAVIGTAVPPVMCPSPVLGWAHVEIQDLHLSASFLNMCHFEVGLKTLFCK